ncbi:MAG: GNAT superfamily N-acetyltransferase [Candidatus Azotimanducaceae bacterium]|jgi:GNAT superfamily N-acetyltransferase
MGKSMRFEKAVEKDKEYFRKLSKACYQDVIGRQYGPWDDKHQNRNFELKWPANNFRKIYVNNMLVGGIWTDNNPDIIQLREVQIHPEFQGQGIGTHVVMQEIENARTLSRPLRLRVLLESRAINLYIKLGFSVLAKNDHQLTMEIS